LSEKPIFHDRSKHIDIKYHFIRDMVQWGVIRLQHIGTDGLIIDILTKPLGKVKFLTFQEQLSVIQKPSNEVLYDVWSSCSSKMGCEVLLGVTYDHRVKESKLFLHHPMGTM